MKRKDFFKRLGMGIGAVALTPSLFIKKELYYRQPALDYLVKEAKRLDEIYSKGEIRRQEYHFVDFALDVRYDIDNIDFIHEPGLNYEILNKIGVEEIAIVGGYKFLIRQRKYKFIRIDDNSAWVKEWTK